MGFTTFRDPNSMSPTGGQSTKGRKRDPGNDDSDDDDGEEVDVVDKLDENEGDEKAEGARMLSAEDTERQGELAEGVRKIKVEISPRTFQLYININHDILVETGSFCRTTARLWTQKGSSI